MAGGTVADNAICVENGVLRGAPRCRYRCRNTATAEERELALVLCPPRPFA